MNIRRSNYNMTIFSYRVKENKPRNDSKEVHLTKLTGTSFYMEFDEGHFILTEQ